MSYQPPHLRAQAAPPPSSTAAGVPSTTLGAGRGGRGGRLGVGARWLAANSNEQGASRDSGGWYESQPSRRDWSAPSTSSPSFPRGSQPAPQASTHIAPYASPRRQPVAQGLQAPASDIKPMRVREKDSKAKEEEREMEMVQSVSRSGGDGAQGDALKDWRTQDRYRAYISTRVDAHYAKYTTPRDQAPSDKGKGIAGEGEGEEMESLGSIVLLFRKLREGVVASGRIDDFAVEVFESSARFALLAQNKGQLFSSLSGLVPGLYQAVDNASSSPSSPDNTLATRLNTLTLSPKDARVEFTGILLIFHLISSGHVAFNELYAELTRVPSSKAGGHKRGAFVGEEELGYVKLAARAMGEETFDSVIFFRLLSPPTSVSSATPTESSSTSSSSRLPSSTSYQRILLSRASPAVRDRAWERLKKAYISVGVDWAGKVLGLEPGIEGVGKWIAEGEGGLKVERSFCGEAATPISLSSPEILQNPVHDFCYIRYPLLSIKTPSPVISLFNKVYARSDVEIWERLRPASVGFGSAQTKTVFLGQKIVKMYPHLVHRLKPINSRIDVTNTNGFKSRHALLERIVEYLEGLPPGGTGG